MTHSIAALSRIQIDLGAVPHLALAGRGRHGLRPPPSEEHYLLPHLWTLHTYTYRAEVKAAGSRVPIAPGCATLFAPGTPLTYRYLRPVVHFYAHFRLEEGAVAEMRDLPVMVNLGSGFPHFDRQMAALAGSPGASGRSSARLWELLWLYSEAAGGAQLRHGSLERAVALIEQNLAGPISVAHLAREAGISHNQLLRLFREEFGCSILGYIRRRRAETARHLLTQTSLPVALVAKQVGIPDLSQFSALMRRETGSGPRRLRQDAGFPEG